MNSFDKNSQRSAEQWLKRLYGLLHLENIDDTVMKHGQRSPWEERRDEWERFLM